MARKLPPHTAPPDDPDAARLEATLARLPDAWTLIADRCIGGEDGPHVAWVLLHPEIGVALVDLAPAQPELAAGALRALLGAADPVLREGLAVPIVAIATTADESAAIGQRLAEAFADAPPCPTGDPTWSERVIGLLLSAEDAAMKPVGPPVPLRPEPRWGPHVGPEDAIYSRPPLPRPTRRLPFAAAAAFLALSASAAAYLVMRTPADDVPAAVTVPVPAVSPAPAAAPSQRAELTLPPAPPAAQQENPAPETPPALAAAPPPPAPRPAPGPEHVASVPPPAPQASLPPLPRPTPVAAAPSPQPVPEPAPTAALAAPPPEAPAAWVAPKPPVAKRPARAARLRETSLEPAPRPPAAAHKAELPAASAGGPPIDVTDLPPLPAPAGTPVQQAANRPPDASASAPAPYSSAPAAGQPVMLLPPVGPPTAMPPPPSGGPGTGALVGGQP